MALGLDYLLYAAARSQKAKPTARARRSLKFCEIQINVIASA